MAAPTLQGEAADAVVTTGTLAFTMPAHQADDILVAALFFWGPSPGTVPNDIPTPSGWTAMGSQVAVDGTTTRGKMALFYKRATGGSETGTGTRGANWDTGNDTCYYARVFCIRGCVTTGDPWDEVDPTVCYTAANGSFDAVTVSGSERLVVQFGLRTNAAGTPFPTVTGWTAGTLDSNTGGTDGASRTWRQDNVSSDTGADATTTTWSGSGGYAFFGVSFKPPAGATAVDLTPATETDAAQALVVETRVTLPVAAETDTASGLAELRNLPIPTETDTAQTVGVDKKVTLPVSTGTNAAQAVTAQKLVTLPVATETDAAQTLTTSVPFTAVDLTPATETDAAQVLTARKLVTLPVATETDSAVTLAAARFHALPVSSENDAAQALTTKKRVTLPVATSTDTSTALTVKVRVTVPPASANDAAQALTGRKLVAISPAVESDTAVDLTMSGGPLPPASETDEALALTARTLVTLPVATSSSTATALVATKRVALVVATETDMALDLVTGDVPGTVVLSYRALGSVTLSDRARAGVTLASRARGSIDLTETPT